MASLGNGVQLLVLVVAAAFLATAVTADAPAPAPAGDVTWDDFITHHQAATSESQAPEDQSVGTLSVGAETTSSGEPKQRRTIVVDKNGKGNFRTIGAALKSIPSGNKQRIIMHIRNGVYREKLQILKSTPYIYFKCQSRKVVITWGDTAAKAGGTSKSASIAILSDYFIASDCTFANSAPAPPGGAVGKQAVALRIEGDKGAFYRCAFYGAQDTLYDKAGRHYFRSCDIYGSIDFIFGNGQSFYQYCNLHSIAQANSGSVTAQNRPSNSLTGFVFYRCNLSGTGKIYLGRAWGVYSRVVFYQCYMANMINPVGWFDWGVPARHKTVFYAEYQCKGPGANRNGRVPWSRELTAAEAKPFSSVNFINGGSWLQPAM